MNVSEPHLAGVLSSLGEKRISTLLLRGLVPCLSIIIQILHAVRKELRCIDVALLVPQSRADPGDIRSTRDDQTLNAGLLPLRLRKFTCKLACEGTSQESPTMALIQWLVSSESCTSLEEVHLNMVSRSSVPLECFSGMFKSLTSLLRAAGSSLSHLEIVGYPICGKSTVSLAGHC